MNFLNTISLETDTHNQNTINDIVSFSGVGIHEGKAVSMKLIPAEPGTGIMFKRTDLRKNNLIPVHYKNTIKSKFCSKIQNDYGVCVFTVEHLLATLQALCIDNLIVEINSPELPAMDGSAQEYTLKILEIGRKQQVQKRKYLKIKKEILVHLNNRWIKVSPSNQLKLDLEINYPSSIIGKDKYTYINNENNFIENICFARTFALSTNIEKLRASGFGIGGNLNNAILVDNKSDLKTINSPHPSIDSGLTIPISEKAIRPWFEKI